MRLSFNETGTAFLISSHVSSAHFVEHADRDVDHYASGNRQSDLFFEYVTTKDLIIVYNQSLYHTEQG